LALGFDTTSFNSGVLSACVGAGGGGRDLSTCWSAGSEASFDGVLLGSEVVDVGSALAAA